VQCANQISPSGRVRNEVNARQQGKGLGLAFVKAVATRHEGKAWVQTSANQGSTFYMEIASPTPSINPLYL